MTPHVSGTSLSAQARYAAGTREILECFFEGRPIREEYLIVQGGHLAGTARDERDLDLRRLGVHPRDDLLEVEDDVGHVLLDA